MTSHLHVSIGQHSDRGLKPENQDFHAALVPPPAQLGTKGIAIALADGISSSDVSQVASETAVSGFLQDYYATPETWSINSSVLRVLKATNSWLFSQNRGGPYRYNLDRGYVCTFSALVLKSATAHLFHVGDARIYRVDNKNLEQLTEDHRLWVSSEKSHLSRALGIGEHLDIDYHSHSIDVGDTFILTTDGVYEFAEPDFITDCIVDHANDLNLAAKRIVEHALEKGSDDNLSIQIVRIDSLPPHAIHELQEQVHGLPFPPELRPRMEFDGYSIVRNLYSSSRSHVFLAQDLQSQVNVVLKVPAATMRNDSSFLESFLTEEWIARKIDSPHVLKAPTLQRKRNYLYSVMEYIEGQTLAQWMIDNPQPDVESVRGLVEQIASGLRAMHRQEMLHQDLRPENILIDSSGTVKLIDFGSTRVAGIAETESSPEHNIMPGTLQFSAPEYFLGEPVDTSSDLFSLGVITYQMLCGRIPYGPNIARCRTRNELNRLHYHSLVDEYKNIPAWVDHTLRKAVNLHAEKRYSLLSEFLYDLRHPNSEYLNQTRPPLVERNPVKFWQTLSGLLAAACIYLLILLNE